MSRTQGRTLLLLHILLLFYSLSDVMSKLAAGFDFLSLGFVVCYGGLLVILAGYAGEMREMLEVNPGMTRRIPYQLHLPNCDGEQLAAIFFRLLRKQREQLGKSGVTLSCAPELQAHVEGFFRSIPRETLEDRTFGNGGYARSLLEKTVAARLRSVLSINAVVQIKAPGTLERFEGKAKIIQDNRKLD